MGSNKRRSQDLMHKTDKIEAGMLKATTLANIKLKER